MTRSCNVGIRLYAADMAALNALAKISKTTPTTVARYLLRAGLETISKNKASGVRLAILDSEATATANQIALEEQHPDYEPDMQMQNATVADAVEV